MRIALRPYVAVGFADTASSSGLSRCVLLSAPTVVPSLSIFDALLKQLMFDFI